MEQKDKEVIQEETSLQPRPLTVVETENRLWDMKMFIGAVLLIGTDEGHFIDDMKLYAMLLNAMPCNDGWMSVGEVNKDGVFHTHAICKASVRTDSWSRTLKSVWEPIKRHPSIQKTYGDLTIDVLKCQKVHRPSSLIAYMCKNPTWIISDRSTYLQLALDIDNHGLAIRFQNKDKPNTVDDANPMIKEIIECIQTFNCKSLEDVIRNNPAMVAKYLHRPAFTSIVTNCLTYCKVTGTSWTLSTFAKYEQNPADVHAILLTQGIEPSTWDWTFYKWLLKKDPKRNTICILGPSNTGKTSLIAGLKQVCPSGGIVNGLTFNFEGLIDCYWGYWDEPLCAPEVAETFKQIAGGEPTAIPVKFKKPITLPRTPIYICTNTVFWHWCPNQKAMFQNRFYEFDFNYDLSTGEFSPRCIESSCRCYYCTLSRSGSGTADCSTSIRSMSEPEQPGITGKQLDTGSSDEGSDVGSRSLSTRTRSSESTHRTSSSRREQSSNTANRRSTSTTISTSSGSDTEYGSSHTRERIHGSSTRSSKSVESTDSRRCDRHDSGSICRKSNRRRHVRRNSPGNESSTHVVSMGGSVGTQPEMDIQISSKKQRMDRTVVTIKVPDKHSWECYLSYIYHFYHLKAPVDLHCYETSLSDSDVD